MSGDELKIEEKKTAAASAASGASAKKNESPRTSVRTKTSSSSSSSSISGSMARHGGAAQGTLSATRGGQKRKLFEGPIVKRAIIESFKKLDPRHQLKNPVMFVVEVGSAFTTLLFVQALVGRGEASAGFILAVALWLWFTVLFANFAEAMAEGRGKLRPMRFVVHARTRQQESSRKGRSQGETQS